MGCGGTKISERSEQKALTIPKCKGTLPVDGNMIGSLGKIDDDNLLVSIDKDIDKMSISKFSIEKEKPLFTDHIYTVNTIVNLSNGLVASAGLDRNVLLWNPQTSKCVSKMEGHSQLIWKLAECSNSRLVSVSEDRQVILWDLSQKKMKSSLLPNEKKEYYTCCKLDEERVACGGRSKVLKIININTEKVEHEIPTKDIIWSLLPVANNKIIVGQSKGFLTLYDIPSKKIDNEYKGHTATVTYLMKLDNKRFISGSEDHKLILWEIDNSDAKIQLENGHINPIVGLVKLSGNKFASSSKDCIKIWE